ncbi:MAG TPA: CCA tRNA nucleotidyltransferase [Candidatus Nanoarchaeia archaeon]|nr:CCA tRNA nucleotidyltransferase [Candidatus Nanoarchaeia archaeon]
MKEAEKLLEKVRLRQRPTPAENAVVARISAEFIEILGKALRRARIKAKPVLGGSGAKGTWLRGMHDIDMFVCFDYKAYKEKSDQLSELLVAPIKKAFPKHERLHGSRDYYRIARHGYNFEIVPILAIKNSSQARNITDASLLHSSWVRSHARKKSKDTQLEDEIRLTKAFCRAQRVYGAESYVRGFSGYACEVLTAYYGSFQKLLAAAATRWKGNIKAGKKIIIDAEDHYRKREPLRELNSAKVQSELIVIDPVQADRNATAALSNETLQKLIAAAEAFIKKPSENFFEKEDVTEQKLRQMAKQSRLVMVEAKPLQGKEDVVGAKLVKAHEHILLQLKEKGFAVAKSGWEWDKNKKGNALLWYIVRKGPPEVEIRYGPPLDRKEHAEMFRKEHSGKSDRKLFEKNNRLYARIERKHKEPQELISAIIREDAYLKDKAQSYSAKK